MKLFRVPLIMTETTYGSIDIWAEDEGLAVDAAMQMDRHELLESDEAEWGGSCGDEWDIEVMYEDSAEDITPPSASDDLWT